MMSLAKAGKPRPCPICQVAMQSTETEEAVVHRCERCGAVIRVASHGRGNRVAKEGIRLDHNQ